MVDDGPSQATGRIWRTTPLPAPALAHGVPGLVVALNLLPVVAPVELLIGLITETAGVVPDGRDRHSQRARDLGEPDSAVEQFRNPGASFGIGLPCHGTVGRTLAPASPPSKLRCRTAGSSNGKTSGSGPGNWGSSPCPAIGIEPPRKDGEPLETAVFSAL